MNVQIRRFSKGTASTLGTLSIDGIFQCFTLEDPVRHAKIPGQTAIPAGRFDATLRTVGGFHDRYSERFPEMHRGMIWLRDVPDFEYILLHIGNGPEHTRGCILLGDAVEQNVTADGRLLHSERAYRRVYPLISSALHAGTPVKFHVGYG